MPLLAPNVVRLIEAYGAYVARHPAAAGDLIAFGGYLQRGGKEPPEEEVDLESARVPRPMRILRELGWLSDHYRRYIRNLLRHSRLAEWDDLVILTVLHAARRGLRKTELLDGSQLKPATGTEVIDRLLGHNLLRILPDPTDGRVKLVTITDKGQEEFARISEQITLLSEFMVANFDEDRQIELLRNLQLLNELHNGVAAAGQEDIAELHALYVNSLL